MKQDCIEGVSILTVGEARGHDGLMVDEVTLRQMKAQIDKAGRVKVKLNHRSGVDSIVGWLDRARITGQKLVGDLTLLATSNYRDFVRELAEAFPNGLGLSPSFVGKPHLNKARVEELLSVDLVAEPAANPTGLFEALPHDFQASVTDLPHSVLALAGGSSADARHGTGAGASFGLRSAPSRPTFFQDIDRAVTAGLDYATRHNLTTL